MFVLSVIGVIAAIFLVAMFVEMLNNISYAGFEFKFFTQESAVIVSIAYYFCYFGYRFYISALNHGGDILNGAILIGIGAFILLFTLVNNIKRTNLRVGIIFTFFEFLIYIPVAIIAIYVLMLMVLFLMESKPVWVLNND